jgi:hypothetical protein
MIYLKSFFSPTPVNTTACSIARWQPNGMNLPVIEELKPILEGKEIKRIPPYLYMKKYIQVLVREHERLMKMYDNMTGEKGAGRDFAFCCWCTPSRQQQYDKLFCHTILLGYHAEEFSDIPVKYLDGRDNPIWSKAEFLEFWMMEIKGRVAK